MKAGPIIIIGSGVTVALILIAKTIAANRAATANLTEGPPAGGNNNSNNQPPANDNGIKPPANIAAGSFPLKESNTPYTNVKLLQTALRAKFNQLSVATDGVFGPKTKAGVLAAGYSVPVSKNDFDKIIAGIKPGAAKPNTTALKAGDMVYAAADNVGVYTQAKAEAVYFKKAIAKGQKIGVYYGQAQTSGWSKVFMGEFGTSLYVPTSVIRKEAN